MKKMILLMAMLLMVSLLFGTAWAKQPLPPPPTPVCGGLTGTWHGEESGDMRWMTIHTSDNLDPSKGEMLMNWIYVNPNLIGLGNTMTPGHGVWQLNSDGMYDYTWYAYVINPDGSIIGTIRVSGIAVFQNLFDPDAPVDCNTVTIYYEFAGVEGETPVGDLGTATFFPFTNGVAVEKRVPMVVTPLPQ